MSADARRVDAKTKLVYGLGDIPNAVKTILAGLFGLYFYTSVMGVSGTLIGIAALIGLIWDAIIDPYIGHWSDQTRSNWGRRHPFMLAGALTMGLGFWASFSPPANLTSTALFAWLLATGLFARAALSMYRVPYFALGAELTRDYHERAAVTGTRGLLAMIGTVAAAGSAFVLFFPNQAPGVDPKLDAAGYRAMGLAVGAAMTVIGLITTFGTLARGRQLAPAAAAPAPAHAPRDSFAAAVQSLRNPSFRALLASASLFFLAVAINGSLAIHFLTHYVKVTDSRAIAAFQIAFFSAGALGLATGVRIGRHVEKHRLYMVGTLGTAGMLVAAFVLLRDGASLQRVILLQVLGGFFGSVVWFLPSAMIADVVDEDELATGRRREGSFFGCFSLGQQLAVGLALLLTGILLDVFAGFAPGEAAQSARTAERIGMLCCLVPAGLLVPAALLPLRYGLGRQEVAAIQDALARDRAR